MKKDKKAPVEIESDFERETSGRKGQKDGKTQKRPRARRAASKASGGAKAARSRSSSHRKEGGAAAALLVSLIGILAFSVFSVYIAKGYAEYKVMRSAVTAGSFREGTVLDGKDLTGLSYEEALAMFEKSVEPAYSRRSVTVEGASPVTAAQLGYSSDYAQVLRTLYGVGRRGSLEERYNAVTSYTSSSSGCAVTRSICDPAVVKSYVDALGDATDRSAKDASVSAFDPQKHTFTYTTGRSGAKLDRQKLASDIINCLNAGGGTVKPVIAVIEPKVTIDDVKANFGMLCHAVTNASSSSSNRLNNIRLALASINGKRVAPGETFSYNGTVGQRTAARGYKEAAAYNSGEVIQEIGGGICQVSTTLFNAVVKADLTVTERHNHSIPVSYVDKGKDATVSWGVQDLRFRNDSGHDIWISAYLSDDKRVNVAIYGTLRQDGLAVTLEPVITKTTDYQTVYEENFFLPSGTKNTLKDGRKGYEVTTYKVWKDSSGSVVKKETLCRSNYPMQNRVIEVGVG